MDYFTADTHFGHSRMLDIRPFSNVDDMNTALVTNWNAVVKKRDRVFHLGDFAFLKQDEAQRILNCLAGDKHLIAGNHDKVARKLTGWSTISDLREIKSGGYSIVLCHFPIAVWNKAHYGALHLHGHSHGNFPGCSQRLDVGVDCWLYAPTTIGMIVKRLALLPPYRYIDHHWPENADAR